MTRVPSGRPLRLVALALALAMAAGCAGRPAPQAPVSQPVGLAAVPPAVLQQAPDEQGNATVDLVALSPDDLDALKRTVAQLGGRTVEAQPKEGHLRVELPAEALPALAKAAPVAAIGTDRPVSLSTGQAVIAAPADNVARATALSSLGPNFSALRLSQLQQQVEAIGQGVRIAVIDTGVDPTHPDLQVTPAGTKKLVDWKDFTQEGVVKTATQVTTAQFTASGRQWDAGAVQSASGRYWFGMWEEFGVYGRINRDLDRDGNIVSAWGVLVTDAVTPGVYDTVYVDTNGNGRFEDEQPVRVFQRTGETFKLGTVRQRDERVGFVIADIASDGRSVTVGFDGNGHGTQVAGVAAAWRTDGARGMAPGAEIMAIKALRADGSGDWYDIQRAIRYAAENGAHVINLSVQDLVTAARWDSTASEWLNQIARLHGVLIVVAAGNNGPGLTSGATLGDASEILTVGAYYSPEIWQRDWGYRLPMEGVWSRTGMGPRSDGTVVPSVVAPGSIPAVTPLWLSSTGYRTEEGTSIAVPHVSGVAAVLMEAARALGRNGDYKSIKRAMEMGARPIFGYQIIEQGHGLLQADQAWQRLQELNALPHLRARSVSGGGGLLARSFTPGGTEFQIQNLGNQEVRTGIGSVVDWVKAERQSLLVPPGLSRSLPVTYNPPGEYGLHSAFIIVREFDNYATSLWIPTTFVNPVPLDERNGLQYQTQATLHPARYSRHFFQVAPGAATFTVRLAAEGAAESVGRLQLLVFRPDGQEVYRSPVVGVGGDRMSARVEIENPLDGTWEVVVSALPDLVRYRAGNPTSPFSLEVSAQTVGLDPWPLKFAIAPGATLTVPLRFTNQVPGFSGVVDAVGLVRPEHAQSLPWDTRRRLLKVDSFDLRFFTSVFRAEVAGADLKVELWKANEIVATGQKAVEFRNLPAGRYHIFVEGTARTASDAPYQYRRLVGVDNVHLSVADTPRPRVLGETWTVPLTIKPPPGNGRWVGQLLLRDSQTGKVVNWFPLEVQVGMPKLRVTTMVSSLRQGGGGNVAVEVREEVSRKLVDVPITVAGRRYVTRGGRVTIPLAAVPADLNLPVTVDVPEYEYLQATLPLYVPAGWLGLPGGLESTETVPGQRKLAEQLQQ